MWPPCTCAQSIRVVMDGWTRQWRLSAACNRLPCRCANHCVSVPTLPPLLPPPLLKLAKIAAKRGCTVSPRSCSRKIDGYHSVGVDAQQHVGALASRQVCDAATIGQRVCNLLCRVDASHLKEDTIMSAAAAAAAGQIMVSAAAEISKSAEKEHSNDGSAGSARVVASAFAAII